MDWCNDLELPFFASGFLGNRSLEQNTVGELWWITYVCATCQGERETNSPFSFQSTRRRRKREGINFGCLFLQSWTFFWHPFSWRAFLGFFSCFSLAAEEGKLRHSSKVYFGAKKILPGTLAGGGRDTRTDKNISLCSDRKRCLSQHHDNSINANEVSQKKEH